MKLPEPIILIDKDSDWESYNGEWRRLIFKTSFYSTKYPKGLLFKATPYNKSINIDATKSIINKINNMKSFKESEELSKDIFSYSTNKYLKEAAYYKFTSFMNDKKLLRLNNGNTISLKMYEVVVGKYDEKNNCISFTFEGDDLQLKMHLSDHDRSRLNEYVDFLYWQVMVLEPSSNYTSYSKLTDGPIKEDLNIRMINIILHLYNKYDKFVHADLHDKNFVITENYGIKMFDFDLSWFRFQNIKYKDEEHSQASYFVEYKKIFPNEKNVPGYAELALGYDIALRLEELDWYYDEVKNLYKLVTSDWHFTEKAMLGYFFLRHFRNGKMIIEKM